MQELLHYAKALSPARESGPCRARASKVPLWILGSSLFGAQLAAALGLPFAFASHFAPDMLMQALEIYRDRFKPSAQLGKPYAMVAANVVAADTDEAARYQLTSVQQAMTNLLRGTPAPCRRPSTTSKPIGPPPKRPAPSACCAMRWRVHPPLFGKDCGLFSPTRGRMSGDGDYAYL